MEKIFNEIITIIKDNHYLNNYFNNYFFVKFEKDPSLPFLLFELKNIIPHERIFANKNGLNQFQIDFQLTIISNDYQFDELDKVCCEILSTLDKKIIICKDGSELIISYKNTEIFTKEKISSRENECFKINFSFNAQYFKNIIFA